MEFHQFASNETTALIARLLANHSGACRQQLQAIRDALDAAARAVETSGHPEQDVQELVARLAGAADAERQRIGEEARRAVQTAEAHTQEQRDENARLGGIVARIEAEAALLKKELDAAYQRIDAAERDLTLTVDAHTELEAALKEAETESRHAAQARVNLEGELAAARTKLERTLADAEQLRREGDQLRQHSEQLRQQGDQLRQQGEQLRQEGDQLRQDGEQLRQDGDYLRQEADRLRHELERQQAERKTVDTERKTLETELTAARVALEKHEAVAAELQLAQKRLHTLETTVSGQEQEVRELQTRLTDALEAEAKLREAMARASERSTDQEQTETLRWELERMVSLFDASVRAINEMAKSKSSSELLSELVKRMSIQFSRVALFRLKGHALEGEQQVGFDETDITKLVLPMTVDSLLSRAVGSGVVESLHGADLPSKLGAPFGGTPTSAVALPIAIQGTTIAVVYADDSDMPDSARGPAVHESSVGFAKLLMGEASVILMCHTHELKTLAELRQYATTLLQEAKQMYLADAEIGKPAAHLRARLKDNLECASQLYTYRAAMEGTAAAALLDEQISIEMAGSGAFARDLASVVSEMSGSDLTVTAEAS